MNTVAIVNASAQRSLLWHRLRDAIAHVAQHMTRADNRDLDARLLRDMGITPDVHGCDEPATAMPLAVTRPGRPRCRWRMDRAAAGGPALTMDWIDPKGEIVVLKRPEAATRSDREPARASFG